MNNNANPYIDEKVSYDKVEEGNYLGANAKFNQDFKLNSLSINLRHAFIRKVYAILILQLLLTFGIAIALALIPEASSYLLEHIWVIITCGVVALVITILLSCFSAIYRKFPINLLLLTLLSCCYGGIFGYLAVKYSVQTFLCAIGITLAVVLALTLFAVQTKYDFTGYTPFMLAATVVLLMFGILSIIFRSHVLRMLYASIGALVMSMYIVVDTQMICSGTTTKQNVFSLDDYIPAVLTLYLDIVQLVQYILILLGNGE